MTMDIAQVFFYDDFGANVHIPGGYSGTEWLPKQPRGAEVVNTRI